MATVYYTATSIDGFIATENHDLSWLLQFDNQDTATYEDFIPQVGALAMGASTYLWVLQNYVSPPRGEPQPWPYKQPTWVFTHRNLPPIPGADIRFVEGDVRPIHAQMQQHAGDRDLWIVGGGELAGQFADHHLLDELHLTIAPVTLGRGMPLFPRYVANPSLQLLGVRQVGPFVELRYRFPRP